MFRRKANPSRREAEPPVGFSFPINWACLSKDVTSAGARGSVPARPPLVFTASPLPLMRARELSPMGQFDPGASSIARQPWGVTLPHRAESSQRKAEPPVSFPFSVSWAWLPEGVVSAGALGPGPAHPSAVFTAPEPLILNSEFAPVVQIGSGLNSSAQEEMTIPEVEVAAPSAFEMLDLAPATGQEADDQAQEADAAASSDIRKDFRDILAKLATPSESRRSPRVLLAAGAGLTVAAAALVLLLHFRKQPGTNGAPPIAFSQAAHAQPAQAAVAPSGSVHRVQIIMIADSSLSGSADGRQLFEELGKRGEVKELHFSKAATLQVGNGAGVRLSVDGTLSAALGAPGEVLLVQFTPESVMVLPWGDENPRLKTMSNH